MTRNQKNRIIEILEYVADLDGTNTSDLVAAVDAVVPCIHPTCSGLPHYAYGDTVTTNFARV